MSKITNEQKYKTIDERVSAFHEWCNKQMCNHRDKCTSARCAYNWLALQAEEEKPEQCFYCGGKVHLDDNGPMLFYIQCNCGYRSRDFTRRDIAIAEHNRVARAVMASKKK